MDYVAVYLKLEKNWAGCIPEVPGCLATGETEQEVVDNLQAAFSEFDALRTSPHPTPHAFTGKVSTNVTVARQNSW
ncbi:MAG TPA: type II toxin-antitoxin system HicB family antitoxin [Ktedonobacterales bacterium]